MTRGGPRNRSGPPPDPSSGRSAQRQLQYLVLPEGGHRGKPPAFPLPEAVVFDVDPEDKTASVDKSASAEVNKRERELWAELWTLPQAHAWSMPEYRWLHRTIANYVRVSVRCEAVDAPATLFGQLHRFADQIGLTTAGLREHGWHIGPPPSTVSAASPASTPKASRPLARERQGLKVVDGGA